MFSALVHYYMPKRAAELTLTLPARDPHAPAQTWLRGALRDEILAGRLRSGARLPATRALAAQYGLSRGTVVSAYEQLRAEGYVSGSVGSGTYVSRVLPDDVLQVTRTPRAARAPSAERRVRLSSFAQRVEAFPSSGFTHTRAFRANQPALDLFPTALWAQIAGRRWRAASPSSLLECGAMGYAPLQRAVAEYLGSSRGVRCAPEQIAIVSGVQEALDLTTRLLVNAGDRVCMESPGYVGAARVFAAIGARISGVRVDDEGMRVPSASVRHARLVYVTPSHQFPTGVSMSLARRLALLEWARATSAFLFEDDYDSEYRYESRPLPALQGLDRHGVVLFAGSFSKVLFPSLRLGYLVVPPALVERVAAAKSVLNRHAPVMDQMVLTEFIDEGHFGRHVRRMREIYGERLAVLMGSAQQHLAGALEIGGVQAGLQTPGWLRDGLDAEDVARAAAARDVEVGPLGRYSFPRVRMARQGITLGFAAVDAHEIRRGVRQLAAAIDEVR